MKIKMLSLFLALGLLVVGAGVKAQEAGEVPKGQEEGVMTGKVSKPEISLPDPSSILKALCGFLPTILDVIPAPGSCKAAFNDACNQVYWQPLNCCMQDLDSAGLLAKVKPALGTLCWGACNGGVPPGKCSVLGYNTTLCQPAVKDQLPLSSNLCGYVCSGLDQDLTNCLANCIKEPLNYFDQSPKYCKSFGADIEEGSRGPSSHF